MTPSEESAVRSAGLSCLDGTEREPDCQLPPTITRRLAQEPRLRPRGCAGGGGDSEWGQGPPVSQPSVAWEAAFARAPASQPSQAAPPPALAPAPVSAVNRAESVRNEGQGLAFKSWLLEPQLHRVLSVRKVVLKWRHAHGVLSDVPQPNATRLRTQRNFDERGHLGRRRSWGRLLRRAGGQIGSRLAGVSATEQEESGQPSGRDGSEEAENHPFRECGTSTSSANSPTPWPNVVGRGRGRALKPVSPPPPNTTCPLTESLAESLAEPLAESLAVSLAEPLSLGRRAASPSRAPMGSSEGACRA
jgi:hypothetical protein